MEFGDAQNFVVAILKEVEQLAAIDGIYAFWSSNLAALTELRRRTDGAETNAVDAIFAALKERVRRVGQTRQLLPAKINAGTMDHDHSQAQATYLVPKEKRIRDRVHLDLSRVSPASFADDVQQSHIICASLNRAP